MDASKPLLEKFEVEISKNVFVEIHAAYQWKPKRSLTCKAFGHTPSPKNRVENADEAIANATNPCNNKKLVNWDMPKVRPLRWEFRAGKGRDNKCGSSRKLHKNREILRMQQVLTQWLLQ